MPAKKKAAKAAPKPYLMSISGPCHVVLAKGDKRKHLRFDRNMGDPTAFFTCERDENRNGEPTGDFRLTGLRPEVEREGWCIESYGCDAA